MTGLHGLRLWSGGRRARLAHWFLALAAGAVIVMLARERWLGSWKAGLDTGTGSLGLIGPVCAGLAALVYGTMRTQHWDAFVAGMRRGACAWLAPLARLWLLGAGAMLVCTSAALGTAQILGAKPAPDMLWAVPLVLVTLAAEVTLGAVLGVTAPRFISTPLATLAPFLLEGFSRGGPVPGVFRTGGVTGPLAGETYAWRVLLLSAAVCAALTLTLAIGLLLHVVPLPPALTWSGVALGLAAAAVPWSLLETGGHYRYRPLADPALVCRGAAPAVCVSEDTTRPLASITRELHRQAAALESLGVRLPARFVQPLPGATTPDDDGGLFLADTSATAAAANPAFVSDSLATPRICPAYSGPAVPQAALWARSLMADWLATRSGLSSADRLGFKGAHAWLALPVAAQRDWVVTTYDDLRECRLDEVSLPFPEPPWW